MNFYVPKHEHHWAFLKFSLHSFLKNLTHVSYDCYVFANPENPEPTTLKKNGMKSWMQVTLKRKEKGKKNIKYEHFNFNLVK